MTAQIETNDARVVLDGEKIDQISLVIHREGTRWIKLVYCPTELHWFVTCDNWEGTEYQARFTRAEDAIKFLGGTL